MIAFGMGSLLNIAGSLLALPEWLNFALAIINISFLVFAALNLLAAEVFAYKAGPHEFRAARLKLNLLAGYFSAVLLMVLFGWLIIVGIIPPFAVGREYTLARQFTLLFALALFLLGTAVMGRIYFESKSKVLYWYSLGLGLHVISVFALLLSPGAGTALSWLGSAAQCTGSVFFIIALLTSFRGLIGVNDWTESFKRDKRQFEALFSNMMDAFVYCKIIVNMEGKPVDWVFVDVNHSYARIAGFRKEQVIGKRVTELFPEEKNDPANWVEKYGQVALTGKPAHFEDYGQSLKRWLNVSSYSPERGYFIALFQDITERKKAEEAIKQSEQRYHQLFCSMTEMFQVIELIYHKDGKAIDYYYREINPAFEKLVAKPREQLIGKRAKDLFGVVEDYWIEFYDQVAKTGNPLHLENYGAELDKWYDVYAWKTNDKQVAITFTDITERKQAELKLLEHRENLEKLVEERTKKLELSSLYARNLIEASLDPLVTISIEGKITDVNKATEIATGHSRGELIGSDFSNYFTEPEKAKLGYKQAFTESFVRDYPLAIRHKSGRTTAVMYNATVYRNEAGEIQGVFAAARDITELKKAEQQAQESEKKLKDAERLATIGATAGMVGHDIRNPLQAITCDLYFAKTELAELPNSEQKKLAVESLDEIQTNIDYINKIVADLQDYAKPLNPRAQETNIRALFNEIVTKNGVPKNIKLTVEVEDKTERIMADPDYLKRIVSNLTLNAAQAMPNGGTLTIHAFTDKKTSDILITVKDTGVGIPEDVKPKLFTPMITTKSKGQGFGLAVVKRMTEGLGGTVSFESEVDKGTTFIIRLPPPKELNGKWTYKRK